jgi:hypothetical protein
MEVQIMSKVFGIHMIRLNPGVNEDDFEKYWTEEIKHLNSGDWNWYLLKGVKGDRKGQYSLLAEVDGDVYDREQQEPQQPSEAETAQFEKFMEGWRKFSGSDAGENTIFTDYVTVGE